jgi:hypothetical protein
MGLVKSTVSGCCRSCCGGRAMRDEATAVRSRQSAQCRCSALSDVIRSGYPTHSILICRVAAAYSE